MQKYIVQNKLSGQAFLFHAQNNILSQSEKKKDIYLKDSHNSYGYNNADSIAPPIQMLSNFHLFSTHLYKSKKI